MPPKQPKWVTDPKSAASFGTVPPSLESKKREKTLQTQLSLLEVGPFSGPGGFPSTCLALASPEEPVLEVPFTSIRP